MPHYRTILLYPALLLPVLLAGCTVFPGDGNSEEDRLNAARSLWMSHEIGSYTFIETRTCECIRPWSYTVEVDEGIPVDLHYDKLVEDYQYEDDAVMLSQLKSVEQYFDLLEQYLITADELSVEYHDMYGYPTDIFIDPNAETADEEIIRSLTNLNETI